MPYFRIALAAIVLAAATTARAGAIFSIDAPATVSPGDAFTVNANIAGITDLYAFQFDLSFDPVVLAATSSTEGPFLPSGGATFFIPGTIDNVNGMVTATADTLIAAPAGVSGADTLASFGFSAIGVGTSALTFSNVILLDSNLNDIPFTLSNGSVTVQGGGPSAVPEPVTAALLGTALLVLWVLERRTLRLWLSGLCRLDLDRFR
jgi:adhesin HecA-like repeat protein